LARLSKARRTGKIKELDRMTEEIIQIGDDGMVPTFDHSDSRALLATIEKKRGSESYGVQTTLKKEGTKLWGQSNVFG
jgi:hypothetical protein